jgi:flavin reductase (NADH)
MNGQSSLPAHDQAAHEARQLAFRHSMANLSAAVNVVTTQGPGGRCGLTATAVCSVTDTPPTVMVCINRSSATNQVFKTNARLCVNVLSGQQEAIARDFAGMTGLDMEQRFTRQSWYDGVTGQPMLSAALASLAGRVTATEEVGTHSVFFVELDDISFASADEGLIYFNRSFHRIGCNMGG